MKSPLIFVIIFILISAASCRKIGREVIELKNNYTDTIFTVVAPCYVEFRETPGYYSAFTVS